MPIFYECQRCAACCRWPGQVRLGEAEIARLAAWRGTSELDFIEEFTRLAHDRRGLALREKPGGECVFLDGDACSVQPVKPQQCRDFPNQWNFAGFEELCPARPELLGDDAYALRVATATGRPNCCAISAIEIDSSSARGHLV